MRTTWAALAISAAVILTPSAAGAQTSSTTGSTWVAVTAKAYKNCTALNKVYKHGVGRSGARDRTSGKRVTNFRVNTRVYNLNKRLDRDKDGIACEKR